MRYSDVEYTMNKMATARVKHTPENVVISYENYQKLLGAREVKMDRVEIEEIRTDLKFYHIGGITICNFMDSSGVSYCSENDVYDREIGNALAYYRAYE